MKVQFICKKNSTYGFVNYGRRNSGLFNSVEYVAQSLADRGIETDVVEVTDNNDIDREVTRFRPNAVIIEALWVVPEKFGILEKLHPSVRWFIHLHSNVPFLAMEGIAVDWIRRYADRNVGIITNSNEAQDAVRIILNSGQGSYLCPNTYGRDFERAKKAPDRHSILNVGCFGAIRPMKNQLTQAVAALQFARERGQYLRFHINGARVEAGDQILKNIQALFTTGDAELVLHPWLDSDAFFALLKSDVDLGMQVSLSETFNVVSADYVAAGIPVVVSSEVSWVSKWNQTATDSVAGIIKTMDNVLGNRILARWNQRLLRTYSDSALGKWLRFCHDISP